jgi:hypothetical protein
MLGGCGHGACIIGRNDRINRAAMATASSSPGPAEATLEHDILVTDDSGSAATAIAICPINR